MVTCFLRYVIDPAKLAEFEQYAELWIPLVNRMGGRHHGYFLPSEGATDVALALFSFPAWPSTSRIGSERSTTRSARPRSASARTPAAC